MKASATVRSGAGLAAALLAVILWPVTARPQDKPAPQEKPGTATRSLRRELARDLFGITPEQEKRIQELREEARKDRQAYRDEMLKMRGELRDLMKDPQANSAEIDKLIDRRARLQAEWEKQALRRRGERERGFTPGQLEKMRKYRGLTRERFWAGQRWRACAGRPGMAWSRGARGWRMRAAAWRWRHPHRPWIW